ncbi:MAG: isoprenylcysteine carboxylmethyltransferase family protein [Anaerolineales bacterium]|nr:isoprenylcysteine carboxylmethyltransferase family protein [Anaerolineales bacterium]
MEKNPQGTQSQDTPRIVARWAFRETMGVVMLALFLFIPAGRRDWGWGWALVLLMAAWVIATALAVIPRYPHLLADRVSPKKGAKKWDAAIMGVIGILSLAGYVIAGLDFRNGWTTNIPSALQWIALVLASAGYALVVWATASNAFFSATVRIQTERGHTVATGGPYRFVRHPSYAGLVAVYLATPVLLGSWWAGLPGAAAALLLLLRTALEDRTLQAELAGYKEYAAKVKYRLVPGIW